MDRLADRLDDIRVRVRAPGADIVAELRNRAQLVLTFGENVYGSITEAELERALAGLARLVYAGWQRQYIEAINETNLEIYPKDLRDRTYEDERRALESQGQSDDGRITLSAVGMDTFDAQVKRGTVRELSEREFSAGAAKAGMSLIQDYQLKVADLKVRFYG